MDTWEILDRERTQLADLTDTLSDEQWNKTSLCTAWKVRDVVAHVNEGATLTFGGAFVALAKHGFRMNRMLEQEAIKGGKASTDALRKETRDTIGMRRTPPGVKPEGLLLDEVVHQQDIRRPLGMVRTIPIETLQVVLDAAANQKASFLPGKQRATGLKLRATDLGWEQGDGPEVSGPGEAILMALSGRPDALDDLSGPGVDTLRSRIGG